MQSSLRATQNKTRARAARSWATLVRRAATGKRCDDGAIIAAAAALGLPDAVLAWESDVAGLQAIVAADEEARSLADQHRQACAAEEARVTRMRALEAELQALRLQTPGHVSLAMLAAEQERLAASLRQQHPRVTIADDASDDAILTILAEAGPTHPQLATAGSSAPSADWE